MKERDVEAIEIDLENHRMTVGEDLVIREGEYLSIDGNLGLIFHANLPTVEPDIKDPYLLKILEWADDFRKLGVRANADYPADAQRAREYGAEGIGLCRTEHMFFGEERIMKMREMILAEAKTRLAALQERYPNARIYGETEAGGLGVIMVLPDAPEKLK